MTNFVPNSENSNYYAFVVEDEVAFVMPVPKSIEHMNAVFASNPVVLLMPAEIVGEINFGWKYIDGEFVPPTT